ncbi:FAD-dependent oxidoreductase [Tamlana sp. 2_MG-2023]|uniref:FAD-dependent oxidoreductase n=1 Tax=unclassified Tamlana TaxID=2614803 RepID=UPI0026E40A3E|nr:MULTISPECIES: FAD-dependent oxidoreductase [unclassified Tamlana]MDO6760460.1 FAD-dependent oxidoreductase [Tamlana sp. 2_MG-2023]MDO6790716.1 FAD-dependent oxidoreductase [Tamlana sp. 1_MG-2023]
MITQHFNPERRSNKTLELQTEFVVVGGGMAGVCAAITAARKGTKTILVQDRPVLGGNASSEVRLWALGATSHMGNNNRWSREGGVTNEIFVENLYRNKEGNAVVFDTVLLDKVMQEPNITLLLNTAVYEVEKKDAKQIKSVKAFNSQNATHYVISAPLFCDASGDGIVAFQAGASFRIGAESKEEFGELFAPDESYGELLGHSIFFYSKRAPEPVKYVAPEFALKDITSIPRYKVIEKDDTGCRFWWLEYGGRKDTIHDTEEIKHELWKVVYGVWDYIKNSGAFEDVDDLTLEWVGNIPGKRESRRFDGLYMMTQQDVIGQKRFHDAIAFGGWAIDLHPADGVYSEKSGCTQWHSKGVYDIPYRSLIPKDIDNLFLAGRIISASHVAFGSTRVMATTGFTAQAVGMAATLCKAKQIRPADILEHGLIKDLQNELNLEGQSICDTPILPESNLVTKAKVTASSTNNLSEIAFNGDWLPLNTSAAMLLPLQKETAYTFKLAVKATEATKLQVELRIAKQDKNYTPEITLETQSIAVEKGEQFVTVSFNKTLEKEQYAFVCFMANKNLSIQESDQLYSGVLAVFNGVNKAVSNKGKQTPPEGLGVDTFEFWIPYRRPAGKHMAMEISPVLQAYHPENICNGYVRPWRTANSWTADLKDEQPSLTITWAKKQRVSNIKLFLDGDYDHAMESVQFGHYDAIVPQCLQEYTIKTIEGELLVEQTGNYQTINNWKLEKPIETEGLIIEVKHPSQTTPATIFEVVCS